MNHSYITEGSRRPSLNYLAHVRRNDDGSFAIHELADHLRSVGDLGVEEAW